MKAGDLPNGDRSGFAALWNRIRPGLIPRYPGLPVFSTLHDEGPSAPALIITVEASYAVPRMAGHGLRGLSVVKVNQLPTALFDELRRAPRVAFFGQVDFPDILFYVRLLELFSSEGKRIQYLGTGDRLFDAIGMEVGISGIAPDSEEEFWAVLDALELIPGLAEALGERTTGHLRSGRFLPEPLPWCWHHDRVAQYTAAIQRLMAELS
ncbi:MAG TPA: hypothetical protein VLM85_23625 [Polyangiaceae bacterium]|nr:hypothetical protein [Polyangiaceae bacterium]